jgi:cobalamin biosynthesis Mg chelatase CobN
MIVRFVIAMIIGTTAAWGLSACGSGGSGTVGQQASQAVSTLAGNTTTEARSGDPSPGTTTNASGDTTVTRTVTSPAQTNTVTETETKTATAPGPQTTHTSQTTKVGVAPASETPKKSDQIPTWGWILIGLAAAGLALGIYLLGRGHGRRDERAGGTTGPPSTPMGGRPVR